MLKFPPELPVHKRNVFYLLYVVGGLLMTVTSGSQCVDVAVRAAQHPANLLRLSNTLIGLMGLRYQIHVSKSTTKRKLKRLHFTESLISLFDTTTTQPGSRVFTRLLPFPGSANCISSKRFRIYYILLCGVSCRPVLTLCVRGDGARLKSYNPPNRLRWLVKFSSEAGPRGDVILLLAIAQTRQIGSGLDSCDAIKERYPTCSSLGLSVLSVVLLWTLLPHIAVCFLICLGWKLQQRTHRARLNLTHLITYRESV